MFSVVVGVIVATRFTVVFTVMGLGIVSSVVVVVINAPAYEAELVAAV